MERRALRAPEMHLLEPEDCTLGTFLPCPPHFSGKLGPLLNEVMVTGQGVGWENRRRGRPLRVNG